MKTEDFKVSVSGMVTGISMLSPFLVQGSVQSSVYDKIDIVPGNAAAEYTAVNLKFDAPEDVPEQAKAFTVSLNEPDFEWTGRQERSFLDLARKEALGTITTEEEKALNEMSRQRDLLKPKLSIREIMFRRKQLEAELKLLDAAKEFFRVNRPHARSSNQIQG